MCPYQLVPLISTSLIEMVLNTFLIRFVAISDIYEPTDDGTESQVRFLKVF